MHLELNGFKETISRLEKYKRAVDIRREWIMTRLMIIGITNAKFHLLDADYDGVNDIEIDEPVWSDDKHTVSFSAHGEALFFIEFGAGIHNLETHPRADDFGAIRGAYGKGQGMFEKWRFVSPFNVVGSSRGRIIAKNEKGEYVIETWGNNPARGMYEAAKQMRESVYTIAKEELGRKL